MIKKALFTGQAHRQTKKAGRTASYQRFYRLFIAKVIFLISFLQASVFRLKDTVP